MPLLKEQWYELLKKSEEVEVMARKFLLTAAAALLAWSCGGDDKKAEDLSTQAPDQMAAEVADDIQGEVAQEVALPGDALPEAVAPEIVEETLEEVTPDVPEEKFYCLGEQVEATQHFDLDGLDGPVEIVMDNWGVPHVYATTEHDAFYGQGFATARYRFIQMHVMRSIPSGLYSAAPIGAAADLSNDVYMRTLNLRGVSEEVWTEIEANDPEVKAMLEAFAAGVNTYIAAVNDGKAPQPIEWTLAGEIPPWHPVDSLTIARLQSWDLSFEGRTDKIENGARFAELMEKWGDTPLAGIIQDLHLLAPLTDTVAVPGEEERRSLRLDVAKAARNPFYRRVDSSYWKKVLKALSGASMHPLKADQLDVGSNNWTVAGAHTANGHAMVANDTHLSLRNPPVFFEVHINTLRAGGDIDVAGASFPGIPAVILGRNAIAAWGATVFYADATDVYMETVTLGDNPTVEFKGEQVPIVKREEVFPFKLPEDGCESWLNDFIKGTDYVIEEVDGGCKLTVYVWEVPHHGPVIPGSVEELGEGKATALSWKWTGFDPSFEIRTIY